MINKLNKFIIVGGGTSGWVSAISLLKKIDDVEVVLIDKEEDDQIGVGEATILNGFDHFMTTYCEFNEREWKTELDAIPKAGILFPDWGKEGNEVWHPFVFPPASSEHNIPMVDALSHYSDESLKDYLPLYESGLENKIGEKAPRFLRFPVTNMEEANFTKSKFLIFFCCFSELLR